MKRLFGFIMCLISGGMAVYYGGYGGLVAVLLGELGILFTTDYFSAHS